MAPEVSGTGGGVSLRPPPRPTAGGTLDRPRESLEWLWIAPRRGGGSRGTTGRAWSRRLRRIDLWTISAKGGESADLETGTDGGAASTLSRMHELPEERAAQVRDPYRGRRRYACGSWTAKSRARSCSDGHEARRALGVRVVARGALPGRAGDPRPTRCGAPLMARLTAREWGDEVRLTATHLRAAHLLPVLRRAQVPAAPRARPRRVTVEGDVGPPRACSGSTMA